MAIGQLIENGKPVDDSASGNTTSRTSSLAKNAGTSGLDKDAFLQLLVAQMRYQDPLQPTDNTEYIAQLATFSQLEATQNLGDTMTKNMGSDLVGKYVILYTSDGTGNKTYITGKVDYTMVENGEVYLSVKDGIYSIGDLDSIIDADYFEASQLVNTFSSMIGKLPKVDNLTTMEEEALKEARKFYDAMTDYQKEFVNKDDVKKLESLEEKMKELLKNKPSKPEEPSGDDK